MIVYICRLHNTYYKRFKTSRCSRRGFQVEGGPARSPDRPSIGRLVGRKLRLARGRATLTLTLTLNVALVLTLNLTLTPA